ncbi:hypothetical protein EPA93_38420 [Ktedonosporobacter rubrisoli]|uniref:Coenzyme Q-binding protein COQ10 START domain-containing protein n=1 Tax=Ktedonosporobacter rubrisoli TaxID=2509675 RepID=A0A4P6K129_KTERU|nr:SRPBCC family protein [Ktedonosporobacter rubrisoli]QBD81533.1 hypothetical protein EPA93_38420 [Ktedonosporobacter rubrisoli]
MSEHHASITVNAPVHEVYALFTHFNDFPKYMRFVKEVTYYDEQRSHWVAQMAGTQEWDAINEDWIPDRQIGWRSTQGLQNTGKVKFQEVRPDQTQIDVYLSYTPPAGVLGAAAEKLGLDSHFDTALQEDLNNFAQMVSQAPQGALDPMQSHYLFHSESAVSQGIATKSQQASMSADPQMHPEALKTREAQQRQEAEQTQRYEQEQRQRDEQAVSREQRAARQQEEALRRQAEIDRRQAQAQEQERLRNRPAETVPDPVHDTIGGRNAAMPRTPLGDLDARSERFPRYQQDPMAARIPRRDQEETTSTAVTGMEQESPWRSNIRGKALESPEEEQASHDASERQVHKSE